MEFACACDLHGAKLSMSIIRSSVNVTALVSGSVTRGLGN